MEAILVQALQGLAVGSVLFVVAAGLSFIWGLMGILNFAHGAMYTIGAYAGLAVFVVTGNYWLALPASILAVALLGAIVEVGLLRRLEGRDHLYYFLLTFGLTYVLIEIVRIIWGDQSRSLVVPPQLSGTVDLGIPFPVYRLFVIIAGGIIGIAIWLGLTKTDFGLLLRAGTQNREMVQILGTNIRRIFTFGFAIGAGLAGLAGVLIAPMTSIHPQMGVELLLQAFIVVIIGGLGSYRGAAVAALLVGQINSFGVMVAPGISFFLTYAAMIFVLLVKPSGLFAETEV